MLVLHIGCHKCGSSSIQYFLSCNADKLHKFGVLYPDTGRPRHAHHRLAHNLSDDSYVDLDWIIALKDRHPATHVVVSSEALSLLEPRHIAELRRRTSGHDVLIVIYIRDLAGWLPSTYNERTRKGMNFLDFDEFYQSLNMAKRLKIYHRPVQWAHVFGWDSVRVRSLDRRNLSGGTLLEDFLSVFGLSLSNFGDGDAPGLEPQNVSHGWQVLEILRAQFEEMARDPGNCEMRRGRHHIQLKIASSLRNAVVQIMTEFNLESERTQYISAQQWKECNESYVRQLERLNRKLVGPEIPIPESRTITERPFLPTIHQIPLAERREIARRLQGHIMPNSPAGKAFGQLSPLALT